MTEIEKERHLITAMDMPHYPLLPVINREQKQSGIIIAGDNQKLPLRVYLANIWSLGDKVVSVSDIRHKYKYIEFPSIEVFLNAGWRVD